MVKLFLFLMAGEDQWQSLLDKKYKIYDNVLALIPSGIIHHYAI